MAKTAESQFNPDYAVPPGAILEEWLSDNGMSQTRLAERLGRPIKTVNEIIKGKTAITHETALQLEAVTGIEASFWTNADRIYHERAARLAQQDQLTSWTGWASQFPYKEMHKLGWVPAVPDTLSAVRSLLQYFAVASPAAWQKCYAKPQASFRQSKSFTSDPAHLAAWLRKGELEAAKAGCAEYNVTKFQQALQALRNASAGPLSAAVDSMSNLCSECGVVVVFIPELSKTRVCGATRWLTPTRAVVQLSLRYKTDDHFWFTFFHEAAHILLHGKKKVFVEYNGDRNNSPEEKEANDWAADFLIPAERIKQFVAAGEITTASIKGFAAKLSIAPGIVAGRLQHDRHLDWSSNSLKRRITWHDGHPGEAN
jgi:addiction module HigA family antidote